MYIPVFSNLKLVDQNGDLTNEMQIFFDELIQSLFLNLSDNGYVIPSVSAADLPSIEQLMPDGTMWYESDSNELVVKINGALRKVTTTAYP